MKHRKLRILVTLLFLVGSLVPFSIFAPEASAATFTVDSTGDGGDSNPGNGVCNNGSGVCTLRAAIQEANALNGTDTINFDIAGGGVKTFTPGSALPTITEAVTLDASTQTGATCGDLVPDTLPADSNTPHELTVEIDASGIDPDSALAVDGAVGESGSVAITGFVLNGSASAAGVSVTDSTDNDTLEVAVTCSYLGTNVTGSAADANAYGVVAFSTGDVTVSVSNSLISGNSVYAVGGEVASMTVEDSLVGTDETGTTAIGNAGEGALYASADASLTAEGNIIAGNNTHAILTTDATNTYDGNYIGLNLAGEVLENGGDGINVLGAAGWVSIGETTGNVISGNMGDGIQLYNDCNASNDIYSGVLENNLIGTDTAGELSSGYGNGENGIRIYEWSGACGTVEGVRIGGVTSTSDQNVIAGNTENGILIYQTPDTDVRDIAILINSIHSNGDLGIDLAMDEDDDGVEDANIGPNSIGSTQVSNDADEANYFMNYATIDSVSAGANDQITVQYDLTANESDGSVNVAGYRLDFYINDSEDASGYGEGKTHLGSFIVAGSATNATHTFDSPIEITEGMNISTVTTVLIEEIGE